MYNGFLVLEYGPEVQSKLAPTFFVLVRPPAYRTTQSLISSPNKIRKKPHSQKG